MQKNCYSQFSGNELLLEEQEEMDTLWYYPYEMGLIFEKFGFENIRQVNRFLNNDDIMTFVVQKKGGCD